MDPIKELNKNHNKFVNVQQLKGLIKGWECVAILLKDQGQHSSADIISRCINELETLIAVNNL